ncbi:hypothetical protein [Pedobacter steynii]
MKITTFNQAFLKIFTLITLCFITFSFTTKFGLDTYEIYLNDKLVLKQSVRQPLSLRVLQLDKSNTNDQLRINYIHCNTKGAGTYRNIVIKDENGKKLKDWSFANATGSDLTMAISVKELLALIKNNADHDLSLYYTSKELPKSEMLASLKVK